MHSKDKNKDLIRKYIAGNYTDAEWKEIRQFMSTPLAQQIFDEILSESWSGLNPETDPEHPALNDKLKLFYAKLQEEERTHKTKSVRKSFFRSINRKNWYQYAAIWLVLMIGLGFYTLAHRQQKVVEDMHIATRELINPRGQRSRVLLPDGSEVFLAADSKLSFPEKFAAGSRELKLEGSAFFEVTKNPNRPFIIHTGTVQTKVLGTSFKIEAIKGQPVKVAVATGKVRVDDFLKTGTKALAVLMPGQMLSYDQHMPRVEDTDIAELQSWKKARLNFHNQSLLEITTELERWYDVRIRYEQSLKSKEKISVMLQVDMPLQKIMKVLAATGHFQFSISGKQVRIN